jgi:hypothetical protein
MKGHEMTAFLRGFIPRATIHDGRAIELALAPPNLFEDPPRLSGAIVEATFAATDAPLLTRLRELSVPFLVDPQVPRFSRSTFFDVDRLTSLPYRPEQALVPGSPVAEDSLGLVRGALAFQAGAGAAAYIAPSVPLQDDRMSAWFDLNTRLLRLATQSNGRDVERKSLVAFVAPGRKALASPADVLRPLADLPIDGIIVEPLNFDPVRDSLEKLVQYVRFLQEAHQLGLPTLASRVGAFGLVLAAMGVAFSSGLGEAERSDFASLCRSRKSRPDAHHGGGARRVYLEALKTTVPARVADELLREPTLRARFVCGLGCCRWAGLDDLPSRSRHHYLLTRLHEASLVAERTGDEMRLAFVEQQLVKARDIGVVVRKTFADRGSEVPKLEHLETWLALLARVFEPHLRVA